MKRSCTMLVLLAVASSLVGCGEANPTAKAPTPPSIDGSEFLLSEEPDGAVGVIAARESSEDGAPLVLVGRIGGASNPWVE
ncbi:MAG: hypothetical protein KDA37_10370, partial [Planctomycetales bacterium]|nr:hypothetical protein [Planctomycetales bacterium]